MAKSKKKRSQLQDYEPYLTRPEGRAILWRQLEMTGVFRSTFSTNHAVMAFQEGQRNVGLSIFADCMAHSVDLTLLMIKENGSGYSERRNNASDGNDASDTPGDGNDAPGDDTDASGDN